MNYLTRFRIVKTRHFYLENRRLTWGRRLFLVNERKWNDGMENINPDFYRNLSGEALTFKRFLDQSHKEITAREKSCPTP